MSANRDRVKFKCPFYGEYFKVQPENYGEIFGYVINSLIPELGMKLAGAVCDFTEPATGQNKLFFPVG